MDQEQIGTWGRHDRIQAERNAKKLAIIRAKDEVVECAQKLFVPPILRPKSLTALVASLRRLKSLGWEPKQ